MPVALCSRRSLHTLAWLGYGLIHALSPTIASACTIKDGDKTASVILPLRHEARHDHVSYYAGLLQLALDKTRQDFGDCELRIHDELIPQARRYLYLAEGRGIDIIDATSSPERDERFRAVPVPLLKGLMGYRVLFVRQEHQERFAQVKSLEDLQKYSAGQGTLWPDVAILEANGIAVVTAHNYPSLFRMLQAGRFDHFPRGAQEILDEVQNFETQDLVIEPHLLIAYPSPVYFYVHRDNETLANRIHTGLMRALQDGSFERFFNNHYVIRETFDKLDLDKRRVIYLCNPDQQHNPLLKDSRFWINPWPEDLCPSQGA